MHKAIDEIKKAVRGTGAKIEITRSELPSYRGFMLPTEKYSPCWILQESHILVRSAAEAYQEIFRKPLTVGSSSLGGSGVYTMGVAKVPTIGFGPSEERFVHTNNDLVPIDHLKKAMMFYAALPSFLLNRLGRRC